MANPRKSNTVKSNTREWIESIVIALLLATFIRTYIIQPFKIPSGSMRMTLIEGDHLFVNKLAYGPVLLPELNVQTGPFELSFLNNVVTVPFPELEFHWPSFLQSLTKIRLPGFTHPQRGDVVVFIFPGDRTKDFIKRLIGLPGDVLEIKDGHIFINGQQVTDPRINKTYYYNRGPYGQEDQPIKIPQGKYFMMGDNSGASNDSRYWGFVDEKDIVGKAEVIFWPLTRVRFIQ